MAIAINISQRSVQESSAFRSQWSLATWLTDGFRDAWTHACPSVCRSLTCAKILHISNELHQTFHKVNMLADLINFHNLRSTCTVCLPSGRQHLASHLGKPARLHGILVHTRACAFCSVPFAIFCLHQHQDMETRP